MARGDALTAARPALLSLLGVSTIVLTFSIADSFGVSDVVEVGLLVLPALIWLLVWLAAVVRNAMRRRWQRMTFLAAALFAMWPVGWICARTGDYVHLVVMLPNYLRQIDGAKREVFRWSFLYNEPYHSLQTVLAYDPLDDPRHMPLPPAVTCEIKVANACSHRITRVRHLLSHFYVVDEEL